MMNQIQLSICCLLSANVTDVPVLAVNIKIAAKRHSYVSIFISANIRFLSRRLDPHLHLTNKSNLYYAYISAVLPKIKLK